MKTRMKMRTITRMTARMPMNSLTTRMRLRITHQHCQKRKPKNTKTRKVHPRNVETMMRTRMKRKARIVHTRNLKTRMRMMMKRNTRNVYPSNSKTRMRMRMERKTMSTLTARMHIETRRRKAMSRGAKGG